MNSLDIGVIIFLLISALTGLILGFIRGGLFIISWLGSAVTVILIFPYIKPYARQYIENDFVADLSSGVVIFLVTLVILFLLSSVIGGWVRNSRLNSLDRSLGMLAGIVLASTLLAAGYMITEKLWSPKKYPAWILEAKSLHLIRNGAQALNKILPEHLKTKAKEVIGDNTAKTRKLIEKEAIDRFIRPKNKNSTPKERFGYDKKERRGIENLLDRTQ